MFHVLLRYQIMVLLVAINCYIVILLKSAEIEFTTTNLI